MFVTRNAGNILRMFILAVSMAGCGQQNGVAVYPVRGSVQHAGKPAVGAKVVLYAIDRQDANIPFPKGTVQEDGTFQLTSYRDGDGAPVGDYNVTIEWLEPMPPGVNRETFAPADRLRGEYATPDRSRLKATITKGDNILPPFDLN